MQRAGPPAPVDPDHQGHAGVGVLRAQLAARPGAPPRADPNIGLVEPAPVVAPPAPRHDSSILAHVPGKSGMVFDVVAMSSTSTPGTARPTIAPAVAIRWSA